MNNFIKLKSPNFEHPTPWGNGDISNSKRRDGDNLGVMVKIENVVILKERDGDNLGVMVKIENVVILKERDGDNLQMVNFREL